MQLDDEIVSTQQSPSRNKETNHFFLGPILSFLHHSDSPENFIRF